MSCELKNMMTAKATTAVAALAMAAAAAAIAPGVVVVVVGTNNHCGPVLLLCFYLILQTKTVAPLLF